MDTIGFLSAQALGRVGKYGVTFRQEGTDCASFLLNIPEHSREGKIYMSRMPVEIWGERAQDASTLAPGQWVHVEGKLRRRKRQDEEWEWCISAFEAVPCGPGGKEGDPRQPSLF
jgi:hypothetical protein